MKEFYATVLSVLLTRSGTGVLKLKFRRQILVFGAGRNHFLPKMS